jgi:hypothetical protein
MTMTKKLHDKQFFACRNLLNACSHSWSQPQPQMSGEVGVVMTILAKKPPLIEILDPPLRGVQHNKNIECLVRLP